MHVCACMNPQIALTITGYNTLSVILFGDIVEVVAQSGKWHIHCLIECTKIISMKKEQTKQPAPPSDNTIKNPDDWTTGTEPITGAQASYLKTLAAEAHEEVDTNISKATASKKIDELQQKTGRGLEKDEQAIGQPNE
jgi:hypothetical protein